MFRRLNELKRNRFAQNFLKLFSATLLAQVITVALSPLLTRLYSPADFGVFSVYLAIVSLIIVYATGRYEIAISTAKTIEESEKLFKLVILLSTFSSFGILLIVLCWKAELNQIVGFNVQNNTLYFVPFTIMGMGIMLALNYYFNRTKDFSHLSNSKIIQSSSNGVLSVTFAYIGLNTLGMILANLISVFLANIYNIFGRKLIRIFKISFNDLKVIKKLAKTYKEYPIYNSTSGFFDTLALQAPVLIFTRFFSESIVGFYSLTVRVIALPVTLISGAVAQVYLSELAEKENNGEPIDIALKKTLYLLSALGTVPLLILIFCGAWLFEFVFGDEWILAGELASILAFSYYAKFVVSPLSVTFFVKNKIKLLSIIQSLRAIFTVLILVISSILLNNIIHVVMVFTIFEILFYLIYLYYILKIAKNR